MNLVYGLLVEQQDICNHILLFLPLPSLIQNVSATNKQFHQICQRPVFYHTVDTAYLTNYAIRTSQLFSQPKRMTLDLPLSNRSLHVVNELLLAPTLTELTIFSDDEEHTQNLIRNISQPTFSRLVLLSISLGYSMKVFDALPKLASIRHLYMQNMILNYSDLNLNMLHSLTTLHLMRIRMGTQLYSELFSDVSKFVNLKNLGISIQTHDQSKPDYIDSLQFIKKLQLDELDLEIDISEKTSKDLLIPAQNIKRVLINCSNNSQNFSLFDINLNGLKYLYIYSDQPAKFSGKYPSLSSLTFTTSMMINEHCLGDIINNMTISKDQSLVVTHLLYLVISNYALSDHFFRDVTLGSNVNTLTSLSLSSCNMQEIDAEFLSRLVNLRTLDLSTNRLSSLPFDVIALLTQLEELDVCDNGITEINTDLSTLESLQTLRIRQNEIAKVPTGFCKLARQCKELMTFSNPFLSDRTDTLSRNETQVLSDLVEQNVTRKGSSHVAIGQVLRLPESTTALLCDLLINNHTYKLIYVDLEDHFFKMLPGVRFKSFTV